MAHRIEVELTSRQSDGTWTWRAAGARQPKGVLDGSILYEGAKVGDVVRADAEFEIDGITVSSVMAPRPGRSQPARLEIKGPSRPEQPGVTSSLLPNTKRASQRPEGGRDRRDRTERREPDRARRGRSAATGSRPPASGRGRPSVNERPRRGTPADDGAGDDRRTRPKAAPDRPTGGQPVGGRRPEYHQRTPSHADDRRTGSKRFHPASTHRDALVASLAPEEQPIAEQVLRGGLPAVRQAVQAERQRARTEGRPEVHAEPLLAMAEQLLPRLKAADWLDRAEAAAARIDEISLRDLRSVVAGADSGGGGNRDEAGRLLAATLRDALSRRLATLRERWVEQISAALGEAHLVEALRLVGRPPDPGCRFPADLAVRLGETVGAAMNPDTAPDKWSALLTAVAESPIRRSVKPVGLPARPNVPLVEAAKRAAGRVPALAGLLGLAMPPPPGPRRPPPPNTRRSPPGALRPTPPKPPPPEATAPDSPRLVAPGTTPPASDRHPSGQSVDDPVLVEELGHAIDQVEPGD